MNRRTLAAAAVTVIGLLVLVAGAAYLQIRDVRSEQADAFESSYDFLQALVRQGQYDFERSFETENGPSSENAASEPPALLLNRSADAFVYAGRMSEVLAASPRWGTPETWSQVGQACYAAAQATRKAANDSVQQTAPLQEAISQFHDSLKQGTASGTAEALDLSDEDLSRISEAADQLRRVAQGFGEASQQAQ